MLELRQLCYEDLSEGMSETLTKHVSASDIVGFAEVSGDRNPIHLSEHFAARTPSGRASPMGFILRALSQPCLARVFRDPARSIFRRP